jgi:hypothetical protein
MKELAAVATAAATAVVEAMATDGWKSVRGGMGRLLSRMTGRRRRRTLERRLDEDALVLWEAESAERDRLLADLVSPGAWC